ncbi:hypothetical protein OAU50_04695 [Planctomycetota bacterium]|nr:hypothetical protein [Planctomycetota bacterium]
MNQELTGPALVGSLIWVGLFAYMAYRAIQRNSLHKLMPGCLLVPSVLLFPVLGGLNLLRRFLEFQPVELSNDVGRYIGYGMLGLFSWNAVVLVVFQRKYLKVKREQSLVEDAGKRDERRQLRNKNLPK